MTKAAKCASRAARREARRAAWSAGQREQERKRRHANIRRGMRIAIYEINQVQAARGAPLFVVTPEWIDYTVALAEGGRRNAPPADVFERIEWGVVLRVRERLANRQFRAALRAAFGG